MTSRDELTADEIEVIAARAEAASPGPWRASIEGRDHLSGDTVILVGDRSTDKAWDMYVWRDAGDGQRFASEADLDFIAHARQDIPLLITEVRRLRSERGL